MESITTFWIIRLINTVFIAAFIVMIDRQPADSEAKVHPFAYANFHEVTPGVLYRSKQLTAEQFDRFIRKYGIKTVINLRGTSLQAKWYRKEMAAVAKDSIIHYDVPLSSTRYVPSRVLDSIMSLFGESPEPILVHCQAGADRTGLFCAAWKLKIEEVSPEEASKQLSIVYGHFPLFNSTRAMDSSFHDYARFLGYTTIKAHGKSTWIRNH
jgi:protein tyrosine/serine phosphatase